MARAVTLVDSGGVAVTDVGTLNALATPMTPVDSGGIAVTLVDSGGIPIVLVDEFGALAGGGGDGSYTPQALPKIFLDTDIDSDIDDVLDLMLLLNLERQQECQVIGICVSSANTGAAGSAYAMLDYYGRSDISMGQNITAVGNNVSPYVSDVVATHGIAGKTTNAHFPNGVTETYRSALANAENNSVVIITTGALSSIVDLIATTADGYSSLNGLDLIKQKVRAIFTVAGYWPSGAAISDFGATPDRAAVSNSYLAQWPAEVPLYFVGIEVGDQFSTGGNSTLLNLATINPARFACNVYFGGLSSSSSRPGWAQPAILTAVRGLSECLSEADRGTGAVNASTGVTSWTTDPEGPHRYTELSISAAAMTTLANGIIGYDPAPGFVLPLTDGSGQTPTVQKGQADGEARFSAILGATSGSSSDDPTWTDLGGSKWALDFDGGDYVLLTPDSTKALSSPTKMCGTLVINADSVTGVRALMTAGNGVGNRRWQFRINDGKLGFFYTDTAIATVGADTASAVVAISGWRLVSFDLNGTALKLYLDGVEVLSTTLANAINVASDTSPVRVGVRLSPTPTLVDFFDGKIAYAAFQGGTLSDRATMETAARAAATAKGITIP